MWEYLADLESIEQCDDSKLTFFDPACAKFFQKYMLLSYIQKDSVQAKDKKRKSVFWKPITEEDKHL
jgi:hypothetical protein